MVAAIVQLANCALQDLRPTSTLKIHDTADEKDAAVVNI